MQPRFHTVIITLLAVLFSGCTLKKSTEVYSHLWQTWEAMDQLVQPDFPDAPPVILIHGWNGGEFTWPPATELIRMEQQLQRDIYFFTYRTGIIANRYPPIEILEEKLDRFLGRYQQVDIVAHSMGGLLLRQYLSHHADNPVRRVVFLATPHFGTHAARLLAELGSLQAEGNIQAQEIQPGSDFLWTLNSSEGSELEGHAVLNIFVIGGESWYEGDIIVDASSAWLPWGVNMTVEGNHHLGRRLLQIPAIMRFLRDGTLPASENIQTTPRAWVRFIDARSGNPVSFSQSSITHVDHKGRTQKDFSVCCDARSGLFPSGGNTLVLDNVQPDDVYIFYPRQENIGKIRIRGKQILQTGRPVSLKEWRLPAVD